MAADPAADREFAPAKVNLFLHVRGQRQDGYHLLESLAVFPEIGDEIEVRPAEELSLTIDGPQADGLDCGPENLICRVADLMGGHGASLRLTKNLPIASGIGGGSADAAATMRLLARYWKAPIPPDGGLCLGADVPVCLRTKTQWMAGIGNELHAGPCHPAFWMVLVNPGISVPTGGVFRNLARKDNPPFIAPPDRGFASFDALLDWLRQQRNDLQAPALALCPEIEMVLSSMISAPFARMSGSGATCFALFDTASSADAFANSLQRAQPRWWVRAGAVAAMR